MIYSGKCILYCILKKRKQVYPSRMLLQWLSWILYRGPRPLLHVNYIHSLGETYRVMLDQVIDHISLLEGFSATFFIVWRVIHPKLYDYIIYLLQQKSPRIVHAYTLRKISNNYRKEIS